jgi:uncharacterized membrane protein YGL010W
MAEIHNLLNEYGESHQNTTNKLIHWVAVPSIFLSIVAMLYSIKLPYYIMPDIQLNAAHICIFVSFLYYIRLSKTLSVGMFLWVMFCLYVCYVIEENFLSLPKLGIVVFVLAWAFQFYGHKIEGKKPSFFKDLQFLLIGPLWLLSFIFKKLGLPI